MKKIRLLPFIISVAMLTSCGIRGTEPSFKRYKNKVEADEFVTSYNALLADNEYTKADLLSSRVAYSSDYQKISASLRRGRKDILTSVFTKKVEGNYKYDTNRLISEVSITEESETEKSDTNGKIQNETKSKENFGYQIDENNGANYLMCLDYNNKIVSGFTPVTDETQGSIFKNMMNSFWNKIVDEFTILRNNIADFCDDAKYYVDNNQLTAVGQISRKNVLEGTSNLYHYDATALAKAQLIFKDGAERLAISVKQVTIRYYDNDTLIQDVAGTGVISVKKGDRYTSEQVSYQEFKISSQDVKLNKKNIDDYKLF